MPVGCRLCPLNVLYTHFVSMSTDNVSNILIYFDTLCFLCRFIFSATERNPSTAHAVPLPLTRQVEKSRPKKSVLPCWFFGRHLWRPYPERLEFPLALLPKV